MEHPTWVIGNNGEYYPNLRHQFRKWSTVQWNRPAGRAVRTFWTHCSNQHFSIFRRHPESKFACKSGIAAAVKNVELECSPFGTASMLWRPSGGQITGMRNFSVWIVCLCRESQSSLDCNEPDATNVSKKNVNHHLTFWALDSNRKCGFFVHLTRVFGFGVSCNDSSGFDRRITLGFTNEKAGFVTEKAPFYLLHFFLCCFLCLLWISVFVWISPATKMALGVRRQPDDSTPGICLMTRHVLMIGKSILLAISFGRTYSRVRPWFQANDNTGTERQSQKLLIPTTHVIHCVDWPKMDSTSFWNTAGTPAAKRCTDSDL
jgi:hypothetical protein